MMAKRLITGLLVIVLCASGCAAGSRHDLHPPSVSSSPSPPAGAAPVLGYRGLFRSGTGWGEPTPRSLGLGYTAARYWLIHARLGSITQLTWTGWGRSTAYAFGLMAAWSPRLGSYYKRGVKVAIRVFGLARCANAPATPAYTRLQIRSAPKPGGALSTRWTAWPLSMMGGVNVCRPPYQPAPYRRPAKNALGIYYRGDDWNWRSDVYCVGPGYHPVDPDFALQYSSRYFPSRRRQIIQFGFRNYSDRIPPIPRGTAVPLRVLVADPFGHVASTTIALTHFGFATATYPDDFLRGSAFFPTQVNQGPLDVGTYTMVAETMQGQQVACSGAFVRPS